MGFVACLVGLLTACSGNGQLEGKLAPDPALKNNAQTPSTPSPTPSNTLSSENLPKEIPVYPNAQLQTAQAGSTPNSGTIRWTSSDPRNLIENFYQQQFTAAKWQITQPFSADTENNTLMASREGLDVKVTVTPSSTNRGNTDLLIEYQPSNNSAQSQTNTPTSTPTPTPSATPTTPPTDTNFSDLSQVPEPWRNYVQDLASLGVLSADKGNQFNPNAPITRRDFARWLYNANNKIFANAAGKQIRPGSTSSQSAFTDVKPNDPDFPIIQGLAEAGLIPSPLTGDSNALLFRPNAPLTREELVQWKVPLDSRKGLPTASMESVKETWGFQDLNKINPLALRSLYADYQNGEQANIKRVFGYTTLFQPKKPVTRAEAAAALWYFGYQGDGMSAQDALQAQKAQNPS
ncbi:S-layer homology domain-containing protein [Gloeothece verrucosa]|uniref:S-layer domain protein n=1 Tax=Gloeothece verrucosa (strain PCC 7822) TaxID=497965 RepID=E0UEJ0_GLOV7|nr:S-layer homology domain-containing protein [Gloeothece verrucosa]ADN16558.1 S-layer domain protein [Gloeothece verrucosa PCC 7822]